jgi:hypothetical protein
MTEITDKTDATPDDKQDRPSLFVQPEGQDWFLVWHIWEAETQGISKPVTIWLNGTVISGYIVSGKQYFEELGQSYVDAASGDSDAANLQRSLGQSYARFSELYDPERPVDLADFKPSYLHLSGARTFVGANFTIPSTSGALMRVRLASVDGFIMGEVQLS